MLRMLVVGQVSLLLECLGYPGVSILKMPETTQVSLIKMSGDGQESLSLECLRSPRSVYHYNAWGHPCVSITIMPVVRK